MKQAFKVEEGGRLDRLLSHHIAQSRNQVEQLIKEGLVHVDGKIITKTGYKLKTGVTVEYAFREPIPKEKVAVDFDVEVLYEDDYLLVVNKPSGLVV
ncbi:MAG TPA: RluA family pseudouridine synthase, partial [Campylobacterales bacterium]|nr:RluA family pseudouridine synthase [Campylobacterales bacterium]